MQFHQKYEMFLLNKYIYITFFLISVNWNTIASQILRDDHLNLEFKSEDVDRVKSGSHFVLHQSEDVNHMKPGSHFVLDQSEDADDKNAGTHFVLDPDEVGDEEEFDLADIISFSEADIDYDYDRYTDEDRLEWVNLHNIYRSNQTEPIPKAANMKMMEYNKTLEWGAYEYLKECKWTHGRAKVDNMSRVTSQNLYFGPSRFVSTPMYRWYNEYPDWYFNNQSCRKTPPGEEKIMCGHFTIILWANSYLVGCARRSHCFPRNALFVGCHYHPKGNLFDFEMYSFGMPCTRCSLGDGNLCHNNLCVDKRMCRDYNLDCTCELNCQNCGRPNFKTCRCECPKGWDYTDCGSKCENRYDFHQSNDLKPSMKHTACSRWFDYKPSFCTTDYVNTFLCRKACKLCEVVSKEDTVGELCCNGKTCDDYHVLDEKTCECTRYCPTHGCLFNDSSTTISIKLPSQSATMIRMTSVMTVHVYAFQIQCKLYISSMILTKVYMYLTAH